MNPDDVAKAITEGAHPICAWRDHSALTVMQLAKLTKIPGYRLMSLENGAKPYPDEVDALAKALKIAPELVALAGSSA